MSSPFGNWHSMMKVLLVYEIDAFRRGAARAIPLTLKGSRHREYKGYPVRIAPSGANSTAEQQRRRDHGRGAKRWAHPLKIRK
jgi:hypothetical protein